MSYVDMAPQIPIIRRRWQWSRLKNSIQWTQRDSKIISLSGSFVNLHVWNWYCPGHELSPKRTILSHMLFLRYSQDRRIEI